MLILFATVYTWYLTQFLAQSSTNRYLLTNSAKLFSYHHIILPLIYVENDSVIVIFNIAHIVHLLYCDFVDLDLICSRPFLPCCFLPACGFCQCYSSCAWPLFWVLLNFPLVLSSCVTYVESEIIGFVLQISLTAAVPVLC